MTRYLVTGASGFVGYGLCQRLMADGYWVRALVRRPASGPWHDCVTAELGEGDLPTRLCEDVDGVFHLAGIAHVRSVAGAPDALYRRVNVDGTRALVVASVAAGVRRFVYFSSVKAVADPGEHCVDETWDGRPCDSYGRSKRDAEELLLGATATSAMQACVLRPALVYGPGVKGNLKRMIQSVAAGRFPSLPEFGNRRSMVSRGDLLAAAWLAMTQPQADGRIYIVADGIDYSTRALYEAILTALDQHPPGWTMPMPVLSLGARLGDLYSRMTHRPAPICSAALERLRGSACYRADRLRSELGWEPRDSFYDALGEMLETVLADG